MILKCSRCKTKPTLTNPVRMVNGAGICAKCSGDQPRVERPPTRSYVGSWGKQTETS